MITVALEFLRPTKVMRELFVLLSLGEPKYLSQLELARKVRVSSSMANNYMKSLVGQGMVATSGHTNRTRQYAVTDKGNAGRALDEHVLAGDRALVLHRKAGSREAASATARRGD